MAVETTSAFALDYSDRRAIAANHRRVCGLGKSWRTLAELVDPLGGFRFRGRFVDFSDWRGRPRTHRRPIDGVDVSTFIVGQSATTGRDHVIQLLVRWSRDVDEWKTMKIVFRTRKAPAARS